MGYLDATTTATTKTKGNRDRKGQQIKQRGPATATAKGQQTATAKGLATATAKATVGS